MPRSSSDQISLLPSAAPELSIGSIDQLAYKKNYQHLVGIDEAGRGPLAGPVVAAAVILPNPNPIIGLDDSKKLTDTKRRQLFNEIRQNALGWGAAFGSAQLIDQDNILQATLHTMLQAVELAERRSGKGDLLLVDGNRALPANRAQWTVVRGDSRSLCIAAASIIAKVLRDSWMIAADKKWPIYGFAKHKGYPTKAHRQAVEQYGPCPIHRLTFAGVKENVNV